MENRNVMLVGLCGRSGSGKGYVSAIFNSFGIPSIDTDAVYRTLIGPAEAPSDCMKALIAHFGGRVMSEDNSLNRSVMRSLVFGEENRDELNMLNKITHSFILEKTLEEADSLHREGYSIVLIDAPLLFESGFDRLCEKTVCVTADEKTVVERIVKRDGIAPEDAKKRLAAQMSADVIAPKCDYIIENDCEKDELIRRVKHCADELNELYKSKISLG